MKLKDLTREQLIAAVKKARRARRQEREDMRASWERLFAENQRLEAEQAGTAAKTHEERLLAVYRDLLDLKTDASAIYSGVIRMAADVLAPVVAPLLARKAS